MSAIENISNLSPEEVLAYVPMTPIVEKTINDLLDKVETYELLVNDVEDGCTKMETFHATLVDIIQRFDTDTTIKAELTELLSKMYFSF